MGRNGGPLGGRGVNAILRKPIYKGLYIYGSHGYKLVYDEQQRNERRMRQKRIEKPEAEWIQKQNEDWRIVSDELWETLLAYLKHLIHRWPRDQRKKRKRGRPPPQRVAESAKSMV